MTEAAKNRKARAPSGDAGRHVWTGYLYTSTSVASLALKA